MAEAHSKWTIVSMAVLASAAATLLHEGLGHGVTAWLRGDIPTELTSNHLSAVHSDRLVDAGGTLVNLFVGGLSLAASRSAGLRANTRYFLWILAALNLLPGAGYFLYSGIFGFGDWEAFIQGLPHEAVLRIVMTLFGAGLYLWVVRLLGITIRPFCPDKRAYNTVARLPYYAAGLFSCAAGALDPMGLKLFFLSTVAAAFGGSSGLAWGDSFVPAEWTGIILYVREQRAWWVAAAVIGIAYIAIVGPGIHFAH